MRRRPCGNRWPTRLLPRSSTRQAQFGCAEGYTVANTLLDAFVSGCTVLGMLVVAPTQPDKANPGAPVGGAGAPYHFTVNAQKIVTGCTDKNNVAVNLSVCMNAAAYSQLLPVRDGSGHPQVGGEPGLRCAETLGSQMLGAPSARGAARRGAARRGAGPRGAGGRVSAGSLSSFSGARRRHGSRLVAS